MTGLEKILAYIEEAARIAADAMILEATHTAEEIEGLALEEGKKQTLAMTEQSEIAVKDCLARGKSAALLEQKKRVLTAKQQMIDECITQAKDSLVQLEDQKYFEVILKMISKYARPESGEIMFSKRDLQRIPQHFESRIEQVVGLIAGASLTLSKQSRQTDGGFILVYGDVEENCSFEALFLAKREVLQDKVCALLFE